MAQNEIHKIITIEFKNSELIDKMREAQNAIKALNTETKYLKEDLNEYRQQLKSGAISQDQFDRMMIKTKNEIIKNDQAVIKYKSDIKAYTRELQSNIRQDKEKVGSLNQLRSSVKSLTAEYNNLSAAERGGVRGKEIVRQIQKTTAEITKQESVLRNYHSGVGNYAGGIQKAFVKIGAAWMAIRSAFSLFRNSFNTIKDFEQANANLGTILGATKEEMDVLRDSALELGQTTEYTASQVTQLQTELAKLGFGPESIQAMQKPVLQFATAVGAKLPEAAALAGATLRSFGLNAHDTDEMLGTLAVATNKSALSFGYLQTAMSIVSPVAKTFGFNVKDTTSLLGTLADAGFDASSAATATRNILLNLADANGKLAKSLGRPVRTIPELVDGLKALRTRGIDLAETLELTDKRSVAAFNTFLNGADNLLHLRENLEDVNGELKRISEDRLNTVEGSIKLMQSAWEGFVLSFYNSKGKLKTVIDWFTAAITGITDIMLGEEGRRMRDERSIIASITTSVNKQFTQAFSGTAGKDIEKRIEEATEAVRDKLKKRMDEIWGGMIDPNLLNKAIEDALASSAKAVRESNDKVSEARKHLSDKELKEAKQAAKTQLDLEKQLSKSILELRQASLEKDLELSRLRFSWERQELENKLKYDKTLTAESREAINQLILNMEERRYKEESEIRQRWSDKEFEEEARNAENRIKMRIKVQEEMDKLSLAQVKNKNYAGLIGDDKDAQLKAQLAVANEELRIAQSKYDAISQMDEEQWDAQYGSIQAYEMARLDAENNVQDAIKKTTDLSIASQNQAIKMQLDELGAASSLVGSLRGLFGALGDDLAAFAIAEQALAVTQIIIDAQKATMEAMVASFKLGPIAGPIWFATQKRIITAQAAIASATTLAQAIPSFFSEGGLVTGPGTGTSDSIPAMLSNGEAVMTAQAVNDWGAMLSAMNVASGGNAIQVSNLPQRNDGMRGMECMMERALMNMPAPIVSVVDINKGQKRVKVQNSLGKLGRKKYQ